jgi:hypothetical protein
MPALHKRRPARMAEQRPRGPAEQYLGCSSNAAAVTALDADLNPLWQMLRGRITSWSS